MISVIVPVYNTEIERINILVKSLLRQKYKKYEVIFIDDGSCQECKDYLHSVAGGDVRFHVYSQNNQGVSAARNLGIELAKGEYITFIDSDDEVTEDFFQTAIEELETGNYDLVFGNYLFLREIKKDESRRIRKKEYTEKQRSFLQCRVFDKYYGLKTMPALSPDAAGRAVSCGVYKKKAIADLRFPVGMVIGEDLTFNYYFYQKAKRVLYIDKGFYLYHMHENSAMNKKRKNAIEEYRIIMNEIEKIYATASENTDLKKVLDNKFIINTYKQALLRYIVIHGIKDVFSNDNSLAIYKLNQIEGFRQYFGRINLFDIQGAQSKIVAFLAKKQMNFLLLALMALRNLGVR